MSSILDEEGIWESFNSEMDYYERKVPYYIIEEEVNRIIQALIILNQNESIKHISALSRNIEKRLIGGNK